MPDNTILVPRRRSSLGAAVAVAILLLSTAGVVDAWGKPATPPGLVDKAKDLPGGHRPKDDARPEAEPIEATAGIPGEDPFVFRIDLVGHDADSDTLRFVVYTPGNRLGVDLVGDPTCEGGVAGPYRCTQPVAVTVPPVPDTYVFRYRVGDANGLAPKPGVVKIVAVEASAPVVEGLDIAVVGREPEFDGPDHSSLGDAILASARVVSPVTLTAQGVAGPTATFRLTAAASDDALFAGSTTRHLDGTCTAGTCTATFNLQMWARAGVRQFTFVAIDEAGRESAPATVTVRVPFGLPYVFDVDSGPESEQRIWRSVWWESVWKTNGANQAARELVPGYVFAGLAESSDYVLDVFETVDPDRLDHLDINVGQQLLIEGERRAPADELTDACVVGDPVLDAEGKLRVTTGTLPEINSTTPWPCWVQLTIADPDLGASYDAWILVLRTFDRWEALPVELPALRYDPSKTAAEQTVSLPIMTGFAPGESFHVWRSHSLVEASFEDGVLRVRPTADLSNVTAVTVRVSVDSYQREDPFMGPDHTARPEIKVVVPVMPADPTASTVELEGGTISADGVQISSPQNEPGAMGGTQVQSVGLVVYTNVTVTITGTVTSNVTFRRTQTGEYVFGEGYVPGEISGSVTIAGCVDLSGVTVEVEVDVDEDDRLSLSESDCQNHREIQDGWKEHSTGGGAEAFLTTTQVRQDTLTSRLQLTYDVVPQLSPHCPLGC